VRIGLSGDYPPFCEPSQGPKAWKRQTGFDIVLLPEIGRCQNVLAGHAELLERVL
jgi:hypothetical protein